MSAAEFIRLYRVLEDALELKYSASPRHHSSVVMEYLSDPESRPYRDLLNLCREIRNMLVHNADPQGQAVAQPSPGMIQGLEAIIDYVRQPPLALQFATAQGDILQAQLSDPVLSLMQTMDKRGFSHVPVMNKGRMYGVFSPGILFSHFLRNPGAAIDRQTTLQTFKPLLAFAAYNSEQYRFLDAHATYADVKMAFEQRRERNKRLAAIFITPSGARDEALLGMITPWDVLGQYIPGDESEIIPMED